MILKLSFTQPLPDEEVKAIQILSQAIRDAPQSFNLLHVQCDFLRKKGKNDWALQLAQQAVNCAPSEFVTWAKLTEVYIELGQYDRTHLPVKQYIADSQILDGDGLEEDTDPALLRLPAPALRGTFAKAYELLCRLVSEIGWDELLKTRSAVFVMEEEYRNQKAKAAADAAEAAEREQQVNGTTENGGPRDSLLTAVEGEADAEGEDDNASTKGMVSPTKSNAADGEETARTSTDDTNTLESEPTKNDEHEPPPSAQAEGPKKSKFASGGGISKPTRAASEVDEAEEEERKREANGEAMTLNSKRLCERWLDNMFMCLYEDLRVWTIFRAEVAHFKNHRQAYRKTGSEWEILGDLGTRLLHREEAKEAYQRCLDIKFSAKAWMKLLEIYADEGDLQRTLNSAIRLTAYQHRWYFEMAVCIPRYDGDNDADVSLVPHGRCAPNLQARANTRSRQDIVHTLEHGLTGRYPQNRGKLSIIWQNVPYR
ncbi:14883_t:CDS:2, partial [Acaulospora colombiana]